LGRFPYWEVRGFNKGCLSDDFSIIVTDECQIGRTEGGKVRKGGKVKGQTNMHE